MRFVRPVVAAVALSFVALSSCNEGPTQPRVGARIAKGALTTNVISTSIVISQVYGGAASSGALFKAKFVELFNRGSTPVNLSGWSLQYASATGTGFFSGNLPLALTGSVAPGKYFLVQVGTGGSVGADLPTPDQTSAPGLNPAAGAGKLIVASTTAGLACNGSAGQPCSPAQLLQIVDLVGYGNANFFEDGGAAPTLTATTAAFRKDGGCQETDSNISDFAAATPSPRNSATAPHACVVGGEPVTVTVSPTTAGIFTSGTQAFSAAAVDGLGNPATTTFTWASSDNAIATIGTTGVATGVAGGTTTITATSANGKTGTATLTVTVAANHAGELVISQIYGGGGNANATLKNDFIEIFNRSAAPVNVNGWSVQQGSSGGTSWNVTPISGTIPAGGYYLVQESAGVGGTVDLPTPDATGTIAMGATNGKVLLAQTTTPFAVACPSGTVVVDIASYGASTNCGNSAPAPSNTIADLRKHLGCTWTPNPALDFATGAPTPRNSAGPAHSCIAGPLDHIAITGSLAVLAGSTTQLTAEALDANDNTVVGAAIAWSTSDATIATVGATGLVTGVVASGNPATITATAVADGITKTAAVDVQVNNPGGINWIDISSSSASFPPGFQTQLFATAREAQGATTFIPATFTFSAVDAQFATVQTIQNTGIVTGIAAPTDGSKPGIRVTATPIGSGTPYSFIAHPVTIETPVSAPTSIYAVNDEFGDPTPALAGNPNDMLIRRDQYVLSYNQSRGTPNWVSYELDARQMVTGADRCNCFTADPLLPLDKQIFTSDYTNGGFDRGHMTRSADRTKASVDNAITFYLTNVIPQLADLNQGVWAQFENMLADSARAGRAVYIITGPLYSQSHGLTFVKNEGKIAIPDGTWKVALIGPGNSGSPFTHGNVQSFDDLVGLTLLAVNMPNVAGVRNDPPSKYFTTVDAIETATGYDILSLLQTGMQGALDYHDRKPVARFSISGAQTEGSTLTFDGSASTDPDLDRTDLGRTEVLTYSWHFSDGTDATGAVVSKTFANNGNASATLTVTDAWGWPATSTASVAIANIAPTISAFAGAPFPAGGTYSANGSFTDPGADVWTATVDYGDGASAQVLALSGFDFSLSHTYAAAGTFTVTVRVSDDDVTSTRTASVVVLAYPIAATSGPYAGGEGTAVTLSGSASSDPDGSVVTWAWDFGDGASATGESTSHVYAQDGSYTVTLTVSDNVGLMNATTTTVNVANVAPIVSAIGGATFPAGGAYSATGSFSDPGADVCSATVDYGDGSGAQSLSLDAGSFSLSHSYPTAGTFTVTVRISDDDETSSSSAAVTVQAYPVAAAGGPYAGTEGSAVALSGSASSDTDGSVVTWAWNFGDGTNGTGEPTSHTYAQNGTYTVTLTVTDNDGLPNAATTHVTVANAVPVVTSFTAPASVVSGVPLAATGLFSDVGVGDSPWTYSFAWGDATTSTGSLASQAATAAQSHTFLRAGAYTLTFGVTDRDGGTSAVSTRQVNVLRIGVTGDVDPDRLKLRDPDNRKISFRIFSTAAFNATQIVPGSARIGIVDVATKRRCDNSDDEDSDADDNDAKKKAKHHEDRTHGRWCDRLAMQIKDVNHDRLQDMVVRFYIDELIAGGVLTPTTTELVLTADLIDGRQIEVRASVRAR